LTEVLDVSEWFGY